MDSFQEFRQQVAQKVTNRLSYIKNKFKDTPVQNIDNKVTTEVRGIDLVIEVVNHDPSVENVSRRQVAIKTSKSEAWYRDAISIWLHQHPEAGVDPDNKAGLYRFALEFFVNEIVLNPKNNMMEYASLLNKMNQLNDVDPVLQDINYQLDTKIEDIKELLSFLTGMEYVANMTVFGPARQLDQSLMTKIRTEFDPSGKFANDFEQYKKIRKGDKAANRKRKNGEGLEFNHE